MNSNDKSHIGIIGAGASGLISAWLLEENHRVTLFEKGEHIGGHVDTVSVEVNEKEWPIEAGAEFFSDMMFPEFNKLLSILKVPIRKYPLSYTFYNTVSNHTLVLPPIHDNHILWRSCTPAHWFELIHFKEFVDSGIQIVQLEDHDITLKDYVDEIGLPQSFTDHFLYPFLAAAWGLTPQDIHSFAAYDVIKWVLLNKPAHINTAHWSEIPGGMNIYVKAIEKELKNTHIKTNCTVDKITHQNNSFQIHTSDGITGCDHLIIATNAATATKLLEPISQAHEVKNTLQNIEYFDAHIAIHGDRRLMPDNQQDWSVANIAYNNIHSTLTIAKPWMQEIPIFRSWITYNVWDNSPKIVPEPLYALRSYYHPKVTPAYFETQKKLAQLQGNNNLWIAGFYTHDTDCHNSAVVSAINIAKKLAPQSKRLRNFT